MVETAIDITALRIKIDELSEQIISGLKARSRFPLNEQTFSEKFADNLSWFEYRLKSEQNIDAEYGRFLYYDQHPFLFSKDQLTTSKVQRQGSNGVVPVTIDLSKQILSAYQTCLKSLCKQGNDRASFGETTKLDVSTILTINERVVGIGEQIAGYKLHTDTSLHTMKDASKIRALLVNKEREKEVMAFNTAIATTYGITHTRAIEQFVKTLIDLTLDAEVAFILASSKK